MGKNYSILNIVKLQSNIANTNYKISEFKSFVDSCDDEIVKLNNSFLNANDEDKKEIKDDLIKILDLKFFFEEKIKTLTASIDSLNDDLKELDKFMEEDKEYENTIRKIIDHEVNIENFEDAFNNIKNNELNIFNGIKKYEDRLRIFYCKGVEICLKSLKDYLIKVNQQQKDVENEKNSQEQGVDILSSACTATVVTATSIAAILLTGGGVLAAVAPSLTAGGASLITDAPKSAIKNALVSKPLQAKLNNLARVAKLLELLIRNLCHKLFVMISFRYEKQIRKIPENYIDEICNTVTERILDCIYSLRDDDSISTLKDDELLDKILIDIVNIRSDYETKEILNIKNKTWVNHDLFTKNTVRYFGEFFKNSESRHDLYRYRWGIEGEKEYLNLKPFNPPVL